jgi:hypothetical protein
MANETTAPLHDRVKEPWRRFLEDYEPLRGDLYRYCRYLTKSPWDAEDLVQDVLARAFVAHEQSGNRFNLHANGYVGHRAVELSTKGDGVTTSLGEHSLLRAGFVQKSRREKLHELRIYLSGFSFETRHGRQFRRRSGAG